MSYIIVQKSNRTFALYRDKVTHTEIIQLRKQFDKVVVI